MVTKYLKLFAATLAVIFSLAACQNERTIDLNGEGGDLASFDVTFTVKDFEEVNLRSHLRPEDEHRIEDLVVWVFDSKGRVVGEPIISHTVSSSFDFEPKDHYPTTDNGEVGKGIEFGGTEVKGQLKDKLVDSNY